MAVDLSSLSDADLAAIQSGNMSALSDAALKAIAGQQSTPTPEDPGFGNSLLIGAGRTFDRIGKGMQQLYYGAKSLGETPDPVTGQTPSQVNLEQLRRNAAEDDKIYSGLQSVHPWATGIGEAVPSMLIPGGGAETLLGNAARMGAAAAAPAVLSYGSAEDRLKGGAAGFAAGAALPALGVAAKTARAAVQPLYDSGREAIVSRVLNRVAGEDAASATSKLANAAPLVPGSFPTAGQAAENGGIAALERAAAQADPTPYTARYIAQQNARTNVLKNLAGSEADMNAAMQARDAAVAPLYTQAKNAAYVVDPQLKNLTQRPMVAQAIDEAKALAENQGRPFSFAIDPAQPYAGLGIKTNPNTFVSGQGLQDVKMAMDQMMGDPQLGFAGAKGKTLNNLRGQVVDWMENANPAFKEARTTYSAMSQPINQMQVGQELYNKLAPALSDYGAIGKETPSAFAAVLRNSQPLVEKATGMPGRALEDVLTPEQLASVQGIGQDLGRTFNGQNMGRNVGSDTFQKLAMNNIVSEMGMGGLGHSLLDIPAVSSVAKTLYPEANEKMAQKIAAVLLDPQKTAALMQKTQPSMSPQMRQLTGQLLMRPGILAAPAAAGLVQNPTQ